VLYAGEAFDDENAESATHLQVALVNHVTPRTALAYMVFALL
jgi:hypothetical protein